MTTENYKPAMMDFIRLSPISTRIYQIDRIFPGGDMIAHEVGTHEEHVINTEMKIYPA